MGRQAGAHSEWCYAKPFAAWMAIMVLFASAGAALAWLLEDLHAVSADNILAGFGCGFGSSLIGILAGAWAAVRIVDKRS